MSSARFLVFAALFACVRSVSLENQHGHEAHSVYRRTPGTWYHPDDHPVHALFKRGPQTDGATYPTVGTYEWSSAYPYKPLDPSKYPREWVDALNAAIAAGTIPDIPVATSDGGNPTYPDGFDPNGPEVCSATYKCRIDGDTWDTPDGVIGGGFDDGPLDTSDTLYAFLQSNNLHSTHFMIGINIVNNPKEFLMAYETLEDDIAVHTWTHPYLTTLTNMELLGEFGWSMEIIHNSTGGRLPRFWRPPYGDMDTRVRAIAKEVFGLHPIIWNQDTEDWSLTTGGTTPDIVHNSMEKWLGGPKSPGLIILEHELSDESAQAFIDAYPLMTSNGWQYISVAETISGMSPYQNSANTSGPVQLSNGLVVSPGDSIASSSSAPSSSASASSASVSSSTSRSANSTSATHTSSGGRTVNTASVSASASPSASVTGAAQQTNGAPAAIGVSWHISGLAAAWTLIAAGATIW